MSRPLVRLHLFDSQEAPWEAEIMIGDPSVRGTRLALVSVRVEIPGPQTLTCHGVSDLSELRQGEPCPRCGEPASVIGTIEITRPPQVHLVYQSLLGEGQPGQASMTYSLDEVEFAGGFSVTLCSPLAEVSPESD